MLWPELQVYVIPLIYLFMLRSSIKLCSFIDVYVSMVCRCIVTECVIIRHVPAVGCVPVPVRAALQRGVRLDCRVLPGWP